MCNHKRAGIVSSHGPGQYPGPNEAHASEQTCSNAACIRKAMGWVWNLTGKQATYQPDPPVVSVGVNPAEKENQ